MAKKSKIARDKQRRVIVERYAERRAALKRQLTHPDSTDEQREEARLGLQKLPRDASPVRVRNRDQVDGRPAATSASSASPVSASAKWRTTASCPASRSRAGNLEEFVIGKRTGN